eukprot:6178428-Pleurochrysis_carterae.AAC.3
MGVDVCVFPWLPLFERLGMYRYESALLSRARVSGHLLAPVFARARACPCLRRIRSRRSLPYMLDA